MQLIEIELLVVDLELIDPVATASGTIAERPVVLVHVIGDGAEGYGECDALADPIYTDETADSAALFLAAELIPRFLALGAVFESTAGVMEVLPPVAGHQMATAGLEMALLDFELRTAGISLASFLGATRAVVSAGATFGIAAPEVVAASAAQAVAEGYAKVKCKIAPGHDLAVLEAVQAACPTVAVSADANGAYDLGEPDHRSALRAIDRLGLAYLEQPLARDDLEGHADLVGDLETPILLDESVQSVAELETAIELGALDGCSIKPARLGGLGPSLAVYQRCRAAGLHLLVGGMFEAGIGRAAALALCGLEGFDLVTDLGASGRYFAQDVTAPHALDHGLLAIPGGAGIGVLPDPDALAAMTRSVDRFTAQPAV